MSLLLTFEPEPEPPPILPETPRTADPEHTEHSRTERTGISHTVLPTTVMGLRFLIISRLHAMSSLFSTAFSRQPFLDLLSGKKKKEEKEVRNLFRSTPQGKQVRKHCETKAHVVQQRPKKVPG